MPTIFSFKAVRVVVYPNDHRPAHVHLIGAGVEAVVDLNCPKGPPTLRENYGFSNQSLVDLKSQIADVLNDLCESWSQIHGTY